MNANETYEIFKKEVSLSNRIMISSRHINIDQKELILDFGRFIDLEEIIFVLDSDKLNLNYIEIKNAPKKVSKSTNSIIVNDISLNIEGNHTEIINWVNGRLIDIEVNCPNLVSLWLRYNKLRKFEYNQDSLKLIDITDNDLIQFNVNSSNLVLINITGNSNIKDLEVQPIERLFSDDMTLRADQNLEFTHKSRIYDYLKSNNKTPKLIQKSLIQNKLF